MYKLNPLRVGSLRTMNSLRLNSLRVNSPTNISTILSQNRSLSSSIIRFNELKKTESESESEKSTVTEQSKKYSRKPLSRLPIGGSEDYANQKIQKNPIEFLTWKGVVIFLFVAGGLTYVFKNEKEKLALRREAESNRGVGKPLIGGPFNLIDTKGKPFTDKDLLGKFSLVYFGFTHCPDICPDELDKLGLILDGLSKDNIEIQPIFITCDPARDSPEVIEEYLKDFHEKIIGLTGEYDAIKQCCKNYRVYFSTPRNVKPGQDYLVDHSIFFYLMDPEGKFIDVLGRQYDAEQAIDRVKSHVKIWEPEAEREKDKSGWFGFLYK
ncbi:hypothetical protein BVG19_g205 [[Candida] boidinii]|nr:hypothetical protein BVG19_g205 [[Candida] boidinii]OWB49810.1 hypothetical protein B5S27_g1354 [[Candida] boidinii]OWB82441.1 hypothetical protein B5S33_g1067 [[Candida] boidinii]